MCYLIVSLISTPLLLDEMSVLPALLFCDYANPFSVHIWDGCIPVSHNLVYVIPPLVHNSLCSSLQTNLFISFKDHKELQAFFWVLAECWNLHNILRFFRLPWKLWWQRAVCMRAQGAALTAVRSPALTRTHGNAAWQKKCPWTARANPRLLKKAWTRLRRKRYHITQVPPSTPPWAPNRPLWPWDPCPPGHL